MAKEAKLPTPKEATEHIKNLLVQRFRDAATEGRTLTYEELTELVGFKVNTQNGRYYVNIAKDILLEDYGVFFKTINKIGYHPVPVDRAATEIGGIARSKIKSSTQQWRDRHQSIRIEQIQAMSQDCLKAYLSEGLKLAVQEQIISEEQQNLIEQAVDNQPRLTTQDVYKSLKNALTGLAESS